MPCERCESCASTKKYQLVTCQAELCKRCAKEILKFYGPVFIHEIQPGPEPTSGGPER